MSQPRALHRGEWMPPRLRTVVGILALAVSLVVVIAAAVPLRDCARTVELVGLLGGAFGAGASLTSLLVQWRRRGAGERPGKKKGLH